jgi:hypothetical protein
VGLKRELATLLDGTPGMPSVLAATLSATLLVVVTTVLAGRLVPTTRAVQYGIAAAATWVLQAGVIKALFGAHKKTLSLRFALATSGLQCAAMAAFIYLIKLGWSLFQIDRPGNVL